MNFLYVGASVVIGGVLAYGWWDSARRNEYYRWRADEARRDAAAALRLGTIIRSCHSDTTAAARSEKTSTR